MATGRVALPLEPIGPCPLASKLRHGDPRGGNIGIRLPEPAGAALMAVALAIVCCCGLVVGGTAPKQVPLLRWIARAKTLGGKRISRWDDQSKEY